MKLRRLQQASFLPCTVENDKRQLQAQSQSRSTSKSDISSGAFLVVLQLTMDIMLSPPNTWDKILFVGYIVCEMFNKRTRSVSYTHLTLPTTPYV